MKQCEGCKEDLQGTYYRATQGIFCAECATRKIQIIPSKRTQKRFIAGLFSSFAAGVLFPPALLVSIFLSLGASYRYHLRSSKKLMVGFLSLLVFWIIVLPQIGEDTAKTPALLLLLLSFNILLFIYLWSPSRLAAGDLLYRGRGVLAGAMSGSAAAALISSFLASLVWYFG